MGAVTRHRSGRVLRETTLADVSPEQGYFGFDNGERYALLATWGFPIGGGLSHKRPGCVFSIIDTATGDEVERSRDTWSKHAEQRAYVMRQRVHELNEGDS